MKGLEPCPSLAPPPPVPPTRNAPPGCAEPSPDPPGSSTKTGAATGQRVGCGFLQDVVLELRRVAWPARSEVLAGAGATFGLLSLLTLYTFGLGFVAGVLFHALGLNH